MYNTAHKVPESKLSMSTPFSFPSRPRGQVGMFGNKATVSTFFGAVDDEMAFSSQELEDESNACYYGEHPPVLQRSRNDDSSNINFPFPPYNMSCAPNVRPNIASIPGKPTDYSSVSKTLCPGSSGSGQTQASAGSNETPTNKQVPGPPPQQAANSTDSVSSNDATNTRLQGAIEDSSEAEDTAEVASITDDGILGIFSSFSERFNKLLEDSHRNFYSLSEQLDEHKQRVIDLSSTTSNEIGVLKKRKRVAMEAVETFRYVETLHASRYVCD
jgi:hypothetical protein